MLLRRVIDHVQTQNWFAVGIDFVIVVAGVLFALTAEQWLRDGQQRADLEQAEIAVNADLLTNLFAAREVAALAPCRRERTQILSKLLEEEGDNWGGLPWSPHQGAFGAQLPEVLPTPYRLWGSRVWDAEQLTGTFATMNSSRRRALDSVFTGANLIIVKQEDVFDAQSRLKTLAMKRKISASDRSRYLEYLHYHDQQSGLLERMARQTLVQIEAFEVSPDQAYIEDFSNFLPDYFIERAERYGDCFVPFDMPFLSKADAASIRRSAS